MTKDEEIALLKKALAIAGHWVSIDDFIDEESCSATEIEYLEGVIGE